MDEFGRRRGRLSRLWILLSIALLGILVSGRSEAATFIVDTQLAGSDLIPGDGVCASGLSGNPCTLTAAVQEANAWAGRDRIELPPSPLNSPVAKLNITDDVDIIGVPSGYISSTLGSSPVFDILPGHDATMVNISVIGGSGITNQGSLSLTNVALGGGIPGNLEAALSNSGTLVMNGGSLAQTDDCLINSGEAEIRNVEIAFGYANGITNLTAGVLSAFETASTLNGVGIWNLGRMVLSRSRVADNYPTVSTHGSLEIAAGIYNAGELLISQSLIEDNNFNRFDLLYGAGGLWNAAGATAWVRGSIFSKNLQTTATGGAGGIYNEGSVYIESSTFDQNDCLPIDCALDLHDNAVATIRNSLLVSGPALEPNCLGSLASGGHNVDAGTSCGLILSSDLASTDISIAANFSPLTAAAIDSGSPSACPSTDYHDFVRPVGAGCDRGAVEAGGGLACSNGLDDDGDGFSDLQDPGCRDANDSREVHLRPGDYVIANSDTGAATLLDPSTTRLTPITRMQGVIEPWDVLVEEGGSVLMSDTKWDALWEIAPDTGSQTTISAGDQIDEPTGIASDGAGNVFINSLNTGIVAVDRTTGSQSFVWGAGQVDDLLFDPTDGSLLFSSHFSPGINRLFDPLGVPSLLPISTTLVNFPRQLAFDPAGDLLIAEWEWGPPIRLDLGSGIDVPILSGSTFSDLRGAATESVGIGLFTDLATGEVKRVSESADSSTTLNFGREEPGMNHLAIVPTPASLTLVLSDVLVIDGGEVGVVDVGDTVELTAVVTNVGATTADSLSLESGLDPNLTLVASQLTTTQGTIVEGSLASDPRLEVDLGSLAPAASATVTWQVDVSDPAPARFVSANAWIRREKLILAESDDPGTGPVGDRTVMGVGDYGMVIGASQKISDIRGGLSGSGNPGAILEDVSIFGRGPASLGDFDGDGRQEIVVGANRANANVGAIYLLDIDTDGTVLTTKEIDTVTGLVANESLGLQVISLGDLDGAGPAAATIAVSAFGTVAVYILFLDSQGDVISQKRIAYNEPPGLLIAPGGRFGTALADLGDLDGAGPAARALAVGQPFNSRGAFYVFFLDTAGNVLSTPAYQLVARNSGGLPSTVPSSSSEFGYSLAFLGNIDADPAPEIAVGAPDEESPFGFGAIWIMSLNSDGTVFNYWKIDRNDPAFGGQIEIGDRLAASLTAIDLDGDGIPEVAASAEGAELASNDPGSFWTLWLDPITQTAARAIETSTTKGAFFEQIGQDDFLQEIRAIGDLDGDGISEIARGALLDNDGGQWRGALHILYPATPVPEPGRLHMLVTGMAFVAALGRRKRRSRANGRRRIARAVLGLGLAGWMVLPTAVFGGINWTSVLPADVQVNLDIAFNKCVDGSRELREAGAPAAAGEFLAYCCSAIEGACESACTVLSLGTECVDDCGDRVNLCFGRGQTNSLPGPEVQFDHPVHPTIFPARRIDFCREDHSNGSGVSCGAPAAHAFCELELGTGYLANAFAADGTPASTADPTWKLGLDPLSIGDDVQCDLASCQGFEFIQCVDATNLYPYPSRFATRVDACYLVGSQCGQPAADAYCALKDGFGAEAVSWGTEVIASNTIYLGEPPITNCTSGSCTALKDVVCYTPQLPVNINGDIDMDGVHQASDNCAAIANPLQENQDGDIYGDVCDGDPLVAAVCGNLIDDDGDGLVDALDPGCSDATDLSETGGALPCDNGIDDDADGQVDLDDPECSHPSDPAEALATCGDGVLDPALGETCDDGNADWGDGCSPDCRVSMPTAHVWKENRLSFGDGDFPIWVRDADAFGSSLEGIGDLDGDGVEDLVAGASGDDRWGPSNNNYGSAWILFMNSDGSIKSNQRVAHQVGGALGDLVLGEYFGSAVTSLGDIDGDGVVDIAVGAWGRANGGAVYIIMLNADGSTKSSVRVAMGEGGGGATLPINGNDLIGFSLATLDDLDGDGIRELAIGNLSDDAGGSVGGYPPGGLFIVYLNANGTLRSYQQINSVQGSDIPLVSAGQLAMRMTAIGDLDGDGVSDLAVSNGVAATRVLILFMKLDGTVASWREISPGETGLSETSTMTWARLSTLPDLDGDGLLELGVSDHYIGAPGTLRVLFLESTGWVKRDFEISETSGGLVGPLVTWDYFGTGVSVLGDLDDDGIEEVAVSTQVDGGSVYILSLATIVEECGDGLDNDSDGFFDLDDPDCTNVFDTTEVPEPSFAVGLISGIAMLSWFNRRRTRAGASPLA